MSQIASKDSTVMLVLLATLAYAASMMTHEALGHGAYCLAAGGHTVMLSGWMERCTVSGGRGIKAAGPGVQFGAGLLAWLVLRRLPLHAANLRFVVWLFMTFSLLISSSYVAFSGLTRIGDAAEYIAGQHSPLRWRGALILCGSLVYFAAMKAAAFELKRFCGRDLGEPRLWRLVSIPYVAAGCFACCSGALNTTMPPGAALGFALASTFGAGSGLFGLPNMQRRPAPPIRSAPIYLTWSAPWGVAAALVILAYLLFLGPGVKWA